METQINELKNRNLKEKNELEEEITKQRGNYKKIENEF